MHHLLGPLFLFAKLRPLALALSLLLHVPLSLLLHVPAATASTSATTPSESVVTASTPVTELNAPMHPTQLEQAIFKGLNRVPEFRALADTAQQLGIRGVYLFGGTAAAFAHYVRRDLEHQHTTDRATPQAVVHTAPAFLDPDFNYTLWSILFHNQDVDVVLDTYEPEKIKSLDDKMKQDFSMKLDFWGLHTAYQERPALLTSPDFAHQHTDSHSTVLIPIHSPNQIYDLRGDSTTFLNDVLEKKLSCYYSPKHRQTPRYKQGYNPELFFAIRALTKAFQYGLSLEDDCLARIQTIFKNFKAKRDLSTSYSQYWLEKNAKKLYTNSIDIEHSQRVLQRIGALNILQSLGNNLEPGNSLTQWFERQPLMSRPIPSTASSAAQTPTSVAHLPEASPSAGITAQQLGLRYVVHSTPTREAYESIVRSHDRRPNAFATYFSFSKDVDASYGLFTSYVDSPNTCTNAYGPFGICFQVHPQAQLNIDFVFITNNTYWNEDKHKNKNENNNPAGRWSTDDVVVFINKSALSIVNDSVSQLIADWDSWFSQGEPIMERIQHLNNDLKTLLASVLQDYPARQHSLAYELLKVSQTLSGRKRIDFWDEHTPYLPPQFIAQHYEQILPAPFKTSLRRTQSAKTYEELVDSFALLLLLEKINTHARKEVQNLPQQEALLQALVQSSASLSLPQFVQFWQNHIFSLPHHDVAAHYKKLLPDQLKDVIHKASTRYVNIDTMNNIMHLIRHLSQLSRASKIQHFESWYGNTNLETAERYPWQWWMKQLLLKLKTLPLHKPHNLQLDPVFETLLVNALLSDDSVTWLQSFYPERRSLPQELATLFERTIIDNVDYFIRHNHIVMLRGITNYILEVEARTLTPSAQLKVLEKIIKYEASVKVGDLGADYSVYIRDRSKQTNNRLASPDTKFINSRHQSMYLQSKRHPTHLNMELYYPNSGPSSLKHEAFKYEYDVYIPYNSASDVMQAWIQHPYRKAYKKWARLKGSKRLLQQLYAIDKNYAVDILIVLSREPWSEQAWASELIEWMLNDQPRSPELAKQINKLAQKYIQHSQCAQLLNPPERRQ